MAYANTLASLASASQKIRTAVSIFTPQEKKSFNSFSNIIKNLSVAKAYRFGVWFTPPMFMIDDRKTYPNVGADIEKIMLLSESVQMPEFVLATNSIHDAGQTREVVYDKMYPPITMTFICDGDMIVKSFFDAWAQGVLKTDRGTYRYLESYAIPHLDIVQFNDAGDPVYAVRLVDVYPKLVNDVVMSSASRDFNRCQVQFAYRTWTSTKFKQDPVSQDEMKELLEDAYKAINLGKILQNSVKIF